MTRAIRRGAPGPAVAYGKTGVIIAIAVLLGLIGLVMPTRLIEAASFHLYLDRIVAAAAPPLGWKAQLIIAGLMALFGALVGKVLADRMRVQESGWTLRNLADFWPALRNRVRGVGREDEDDAPSLRAADRHPDAPARRPFSIARDVAGGEEWEMKPSRLPRIRSSTATIDEAVAEDVPVEQYADREDADFEGGEAENAELLLDGKFAQNESRVRRQILTEETAPGFGALEETPDDAALLAQVSATALPVPDSAVDTGDVTGLNVGDLYRSGTGSVSPTPVSPDKDTSLSSVDEVEPLDLGIYGPQDDAAVPLPVSLLNIADAPPEEGEPVNTDAPMEHLVEDEPLDLDQLAEAPLPEDTGENSDVADRTEQLEAVTRTEEKGRDIPLQSRAEPEPLDLSVARLDDLLARLEAGLTRRHNAVERAQERAPVAVANDVSPLADEIEAPESAPVIPSPEEELVIPPDPALAAALATLRRMRQHVG